MNLSDAAVSQILIPVDDFNQLALLSKVPVVPA